MLAASTVQALRNIRAGYGPLVRGVKMKNLEAKGLVARDGHVWKITKSGVDALIAQDAL